MKISVKKPRFYLPAALRRRGAALLHQQCWYWGRDVECAAGNLLLAYGFTRHRQPEGSTPRGGSAYQFQVDAQRVIVLWGFGLFYGDVERGGMYLRRYGFLPKLLRASELSLPIWTSDQLPPRRTPSTAEEVERTLYLLQQSVQWIAAYEEWVMQHFGLDYRRRCLQAWKQDRIAPELFIQYWRELQAHCEIILNQQREKIV